MQCPHRARHVSHQMATNFDKLVVMAGGQPRGIPKDVATRWTSSFELITCLNGFHDVVVTFRTKHHDVEQKMDDHDWLILGDLEVVLKDLIDVTKFLETTGLS